MYVHSYTQIALYLSHTYLPSSSSTFTLRLFPLYIRSNTAMMHPSASVTACLDGPRIELIKD